MLNPLTTPSEKEERMRRINAERAEKARAALESYMKSDLQTALTDLLADSIILAGIDGEELRPEELERILGRALSFSKLEAS